MRLTSARDLKSELLESVVLAFAAERVVLHAATPQAIGRAGFAAVPGSMHTLALGAQAIDAVSGVHRSIALGIASRGREYRLAVRVQRQALMHSPLVDHLKARAKNEIDIRMIGRVDKRAGVTRASKRASVTARAASALPWYQQDCRPLRLGASIAHVDVTAGTLGGFVSRGNAVYVLSNNHVLANENSADVGDWVLQRAPLDGGRKPTQRVGQLRFWQTLEPSGTNFVDAALAEIRNGVDYDPNLLRELVKRKDRRLAGVGPSFVDEGTVVYKVGRTTGPTQGRVTAFDLDNVVVNYNLGNLRFDGQIEIESVGKRLFSDGGDSGSLIVNAEMQAIGLLFAGGETGGSNGLGLTYAHPIAAVLNTLKATLLF